MIDYFKDVDGHKVINPSLVTVEADKYAKSFFENPKEELKATQLRKFYNDVKTLERRFRTTSAGGKEDREFAFAQILPMLKLLKAKTAYAHKRKVVPESFRNWMWENVDKVNTYRDFKAFLLHFEAVVGFSYGHARKDFN